MARLGRRRPPLFRGRGGGDHAGAAGPDPGGPGDPQRGRGGAGADAPAPRTGPRRARRRDGHRAGGPGGAGRCHHRAPGRADPGRRPGAVGREPGGRKPGHRRKPAGRQGPGGRRDRRLDQRRRPAAGRGDRGRPAVHARPDHRHGAVGPSVEAAGAAAGRPGRQRVRARRGGGRGRDLRRLDTGGRGRRDGTDLPPSRCW